MEIPTSNSFIHEKSKIYHVYIYLTPLDINLLCKLLRLPLPGGIT